MRITLAAVGRAKTGPLRDLYRHYAERLKWNVTLKEVEERRKLPAEALRAREAELLLAAVPGGAKTIVLDERGKALTSRELARLLGRWRDDGEADLAILIGGADGLTAEVRDSADQVVSFGAMTWPHMLVRALLMEQLYRAETILAGHPYHRD